MAAASARPIRLVYSRKNGRPLLKSLPPSSKPPLNSSPEPSVTDRLMAKLLQLHLERPAALVVLEAAIDSLLKPPG